MFGQKQYMDSFILLTRSNDLWLITTFLSFSGKFRKNSYDSIRVKKIDDALLLTSGNF